MYCQACGNKLEEEVQFCAKCGTPRGEASNGKKLASANQRLANYLIDRIGSYVVAFILILILGGDSNFTWLVGIIILGGYHLFFEGIWHATPGKWITKTKVVKIDGTPLTFAAILLRTLCRIIPFEPFSFLFGGGYPRGWHDSLTGTAVVPEEYTAEDVKSINLVAMKNEKSHAWVVVIIVAASILVMMGVISSIVLTSLSAARVKGLDARIQATVSSALIQAEITAEGGSYSHPSICQFGLVGTNPMIKNLAQEVAVSKSSLKCSSTDTGVAFFAKLSDGSYFCADNGDPIFSGKISIPPTSVAGACR